MMTTDDLPRLISASVGTVVYYGFQCHPNLRNGYLALCFLTGLAGNIFPFMKWFNSYANRVSCLTAFIHIFSDNSNRDGALFSS